MMTSKIQQVKARYKYSLILLRQLVITDFKIRYQGSALGYLWTLLRPIGLFVVLYIVFAKFLKVGEAVPHYPVYLLLGIVFWNYFVEVTMGGVGAIVGKGDILRKLSFPRYVIVLAGSLSALINLGINMVVLMLVMIISDTPFRAVNILVIFPIIQLFALSLSVAFILSALYVRLRDVNYIWEVILQAAFYATPILYPIAYVIGVSPSIAKLMMLNPMAQLLQDARVLLVTSRAETISDVFGNQLIRLVPYSIVIILVVFSVWYFRKRSPYFAEEL